MFAFSPESFSVEAFSPSAFSIAAEPAAQTEVVGGGRQRRAKSVPVDRRYGLAAEGEGASNANVIATREAMVAAFAGGYSEAIIVPHVEVAPLFAGAGESRGRVTITREETPVFDEAEMAALALYLVRRRH